MRRAIVTGSGGLVGSETVAHLVEAGFDVVGLENDMRSYFFGPEASTRPQTERLLDAYGDGFRSIDTEIRDGDAVDSLFAEYRAGLELIVHTAAQPSHDWAASEPRTDFTINANGTLNLLESTRRHSPDATFVFASTNKVYGDRPNTLPFVELETRLELPDDHEYYAGIPTPSRSTSRCTRSSACRRRPPTCSSRSTGVTSACPPCASAAAASPAQTTRALDCTASFPT